VENAQQVAQACLLTGETFASVRQSHEPAVGLQAEGGGSKPFSAKFELYSSTIAFALTKRLVGNAGISDREGPPICFGLPTQHFNACSHFRRRLAHPIIVRWRRLRHRRGSEQTEQKHCCDRCELRQTSLDRAAFGMVNHRSTPKWNGNEVSVPCGENCNQEAIRPQRCAEPGASHADTQGLSGKADQP
jgi:hypothetical protein